METNQTHTVTKNPAYEGSEIYYLDCSCGWHSQDPSNSDDFAQQIAQHDGMVEGGGRASLASVAHDLMTANYKLRQAVRAAREDDATWTEIGLMLGISRQAAHERWARYCK